MSFKKISSVSVSSNAYVYIQFFFYLCPIFGRRSGDVVAPGFYENLLNADNVLYRPYGSGEAAAFNLAYNIHVLLYQWESDQADMEEQDRVLRDLNVGEFYCYQFRGMEVSFTVINVGIRRRVLWYVGYCFTVINVGIFR